MFGFLAVWADARSSLHDPGDEGGTGRDIYAARLDADGQLITGPEQQPNNFQWIITARTGQGNFGYLGFTNVWYGQYHDAEYHATKVYPITDRPVYRPGQTVHYKLWVRHARYDQDDTSDFAGRTFVLQIKNPKGETVVEEEVKADEFGGVEGIVTMRDVLAFIFGHLSGEIEGQALYEERDENVYEVPGEMKLVDFNNLTNFGIEDPRMTTIGGVAFRHLDRLPRVGDQVTVEGITITILEMDEHRIARVRVSRGEGAEEAATVDQPETGEPATAVATGEPGEHENAAGGDATLSGGDAASGGTGQTSPREKPAGPAPAYPADKTGQDDESQSSQEAKALH